VDPFAGGMHQQKMIVGAALQHVGVTAHIEANRLDLGSMAGRLDKRQVVPFLHYVISWGDELRCNCSGTLHGHGTHHRIAWI